MRAHAFQRGRFVLWAGPLTAFGAVHPNCPAQLVFERIQQIRRAFLSTLFRLELPLFRERITDAQHVAGGLAQ
jgi:hypothetical protein